MRRKNIAIFGGGPAAMAAAYFLAQNNNITIFEKENNIGQKFLVAGKGGFNLTNSLVQNELVKKYSPRNFLDNAILEFDSTSVRNWLMEIGIPTFVGTSERVFSIKELKPIDVLNRIKNSLTAKNVKIITNQKFTGFNNKNEPIVNGKTIIIADYYIFALGGASWSLTGSDGKWVNSFNELGIGTLPFQASNCGVNINWPDNVKSFHEGKPLKNIRISCGELTSKGEAVITEYGLEGNAIYSLIPKIRELIKQNLQACIFIDFKPNNSLQQLSAKLKESTSSKNYRKAFNLGSTEIALIKSFTKKEDYLIPSSFIKSIKSLEIKINSLRPIEEAISTVGGIDINELNPDFSLKKFPHIFTIGEMVDWDAPTGGFLLQGCFSMGHHAAKSIS